MPDTTTRAREIAAELDKIAPYDPEHPTAATLAKHLAVTADLAWWRSIGLAGSPGHEMQDADLSITVLAFTACRALTILDRADRATADACAIGIAEMIGDGSGVGEWIYEHLGDDAERIGKLAQELAETTVVKPGKATNGPWGPLTQDDLRAILTTKGVLPDDLYVRLCVAAGMPS